MNNTVRLYGKTVNTWKALDPARNREVITQYEIEYKEYRLDGTLCGTGTEDFSRERYRDLTDKWIYTWDGQKRNKGGYRWFEEQGSVKFNKHQRKEINKLMADKYPEAEMIQLR